MHVNKLSKQMFRCDLSRLKVWRDLMDKGKSFCTTGAE